MHLRHHAPKLGIKELWRHDNHERKKNEPGTVDLIDPGTLYWLPQGIQFATGFLTLFMSLFHMHCRSACEANLTSSPGNIPLVFVDPTSD